MNFSKDKACYGIVYFTFLKFLVASSVGIDKDSIPKDVEIDQALIKELHNTEMSPADLEIVKDEESGKSFIRSKSQMGDVKGELSPLGMLRVRCLPSVYSGDVKGELSSLGMQRAHCLPLSILGMLKVSCLPWRC